jgi:hypothetical protein
MMFIIRAAGAAPNAADIQVKTSRSTPDYVPGYTGNTDYFCIADPETIERLRDSGTPIVPVHDGYYEDGRGGGVVIWGQGKYWEIRDTPFTVKEACGPAEPPRDGTAGEHVEVRRAIFGA